MLGVGNLGTAVGRPRWSSATSTKRPRVHSCRLPESICSANNFTSTFMEVFTTAISMGRSRRQTVIILVGYPQWDVIEKPMGIVTREFSEIETLLVDLGRSFYARGWALGTS